MKSPKAGVKSSTTIKSALSPPSHNPNHKSTIKPKSKHRSYVLQSIRQLQLKIEELKALKSANKDKKKVVEKVRYVDVPIERVVENEIIQYVDRIVQKQEEVIEYEQVERVVEVVKEVPREVWSQRVIVRPPMPAEVITVEVPVVKEVVKYVEENFDEGLYQEVERERRHCQELEMQLEANLRTIHRLKQELTQLHH